MLQQCSGVLTNYKMLYEKPMGEHLQILVTFFSNSFVKIEVKRLKWFLNQISHQINVK